MTSHDDGHCQQSLDDGIEFPQEWRDQLLELSPPDFDGDRLNWSDDLV